MSGRGELLGRLVTDTSCDLLDLPQSLFFLLQVLVEQPDRLLLTERLCHAPQRLVGGDLVVLRSCGCAEIDEIHEGGRRLLQQLVVLLSQPVEPKARLGLRLLVERAEYLLHVLAC